ncbi:tRNA modification GTPase MnmE [Frankliniella fusca]|uniref:tRNA modification GTPase MnmE n=1 Tax=Frankliniella fusca TaxID=407009 RepID=A0AAE1HVX5_9NEOP|nr:tRNA modification GTPase MnmE [Frankliniella fusca]
MQATFALVASVAAADPPGPGPAPAAKPSSLSAVEDRHDIPDIPDLQDVDSDSEAEASDTKMMAASGGAGAGMHGHGKFFQDFYSLQYGPRQVEFGHVCEDPNEWEQRFERKDLDKDHHQGQVCVFMSVPPSSPRLSICLPVLPARRYGHHDGKDHYENGFRRGNEHHFHERHEKGAPKHGHFTTKVRWGDKHGGYGEHYWDYNHGGHHDGGDSAPVPDILEHPDEDRRPQFKRQSAYDQAGAASSTGAGGEAAAAKPGRSRAYRKKYVRPTSTPAAPTHPVPRARTTPRPQPYRQPPPPPAAATAQQQPLSKSTKSATFFTPDFPPGGMFQSAAAAAGLGPRMARQTPGQADSPAQLGHAVKGQQQQQQQQQQRAQPGGQPKGQGGAGAAGPQVTAALVRRLAFDPRTGRVHDEDTGQVFVLQPVS